MKFLLLRLPEEWQQPGILAIPPATTSIYPPLGLLYLGAMIEQEGHTVEVIDFGAETLSKERLKHSLIDADAVGISTYSNNYTSTEELAHIIKEVSPNIPLIIGGPHCIFRQRFALQDVPSADIAVVAEGEAVIPDIIRFIQGKIPLRDIPGIYYRKNGVIQKGKPSTIIENLDTLPFPARHMVAKYEYGKYPWGSHSHKKFTSIITSRGCAFHCRFCARYGNIIPGFDFRQRSAESVISELLEVNSTYGSVSIVDDNFLADKKRSNKIFDGLLEAKTTLDIIIVGARVDTAEKELYKKMKKAGVIYISYGIETGNQDVLDYYQKKVTLDQIRKAVHLARDMGFFVSASFIFGAPIETEEHLKKSIKFICSLPLDTAVVRPFYYARGAELYTDELQKGTITTEEWRTRADVNRQLGNMSIKEVDEYIEKAFRRFYLRPRYILGQLSRALRQKDFERIKIMTQLAISPQMKNLL
jgi:anaerobic magnesium-protoporphyrin IX monomethyl ester cyclase